MLQSLVMNSADFTHILRVLSTNVDGKQKVPFAMTAIKGVGRRFADVCCKKADIDVQKRCAPSTTFDRVYGVGMQSHDMSVKHVWRASYRPAPRLSRNAGKQSHQSHVPRLVRISSASRTRLQRR